MPHYKSFYKSKVFTYILVFTFFFLLIFTSVLIYEEKINIVELWSSAGAQLAILIPIIWNIVKSYKSKKNEKGN